MCCPVLDALFGSPCAAANTLCCRHHLVLRPPPCAAVLVLCCGSRPAPQLASCAATLSDAARPQPQPRPPLPTRMIAFVGFSPGAARRGLRKHGDKPPSSSGRCPVSQRHLVPRQVQPLRFLLAPSPLRGLMLPATTRRARRWQRSNTRWGGCVRRRTFAMETSGLWGSSWPAVTRSSNPS